MTRGAHRSHVKDYTQDILRLKLAAEAARILAEEGVTDYQLAKRKAAARIMSGHRQVLPTNSEIERALIDHLQIFQSSSLTKRIIHYRNIAQDAMQFFHAYQSRLVGDALSGAITEHSEIQIHLAADVPEDVAQQLYEVNIPHQESSRRIRFGGDRYINLPGFRYRANEVIVELVVFSCILFRQTPMSPVDGKSIKYVNRKGLKNMTEGHSH